MDKGKMAEVKKVNALSAGKISALLGAFTGFVLGVVLSIILRSLSNNSQLQQATGISALSTNQLIILPFQYLLILGLICGLSGLLLAWVYNLIAKYSGGLKIELK
jgi:tetrahydromethanopterin S-methyltransferase subunit C